MKRKEKKKKKKMSSHKYSGGKEREREREKKRAEGSGFIAAHSIKGEKFSYCFNNEKERISSKWQQIIWGTKASPKCYGQDYLCRGNKHRARGFTAHRDHYDRSFYFCLPYCSSYFFFSRPSLLPFPSISLPPTQNPPLLSLSIYLNSN